MKLKNLHYKQRPKIQVKKITKESSKLCFNYSNYLTQLCQTEPLKVNVIWAISHFFLEWDNMFIGISNYDMLQMLLMQQLICWAPVSANGHENVR